MTTAPDDTLLGARLDPAIAARLEELVATFPPATTDPVDFHRARFDAGLAWVHYPKGCGGMAADPGQHRLVEECLSAAGGPSPFPANPIGIGMVGPTIVHHGTAEQQAQYLRRMWTGEDVWCQLFSEPGAGSDLAGLSTRAVRDGDEWVVTGEKVWTSLGRRARYALLLARTDVEAPKHRGLTTFLVDMHADGVDVRPLRQMTGDSEFSQVHLDGVRLPLGAQLGSEGAGWRVATTTLMNERVSIGNALASSGDGPSATAIALYRDRHTGDAVLRDRVVLLWVESEVARMMSLRAAQLGQTGDPGPVGSVGKLFSAEHALRVHELIVTLLGADGLLYPDPGANGSPSQRTPHVAFLRSRANTIEGGTSEIMRNILGERILGLPRDDDAARARPWREVPRN